MRAPITDKHLFEMMWERFPEIMKRGVEQPAPAQQEQKTACEMLTAYLIDNCEGGIISEEGLQCAMAEMLADPKYATPPAAQRTWVGLTDEQRINISYKADGNECVAVELTEAKLKELNNAN
jgi:hypothetical protein